MINQSNVSDLGSISPMCLIWDQCLYQKTQTLWLNRCSRLTYIHRLLHCRSIQVLNFLLLNYFINQQIQWFRYQSHLQTAAPTSCLYIRPAGRRRKSTSYFVIDWLIDLWSAESHTHLHVHWASPFVCVSTCLFKARVPDGPACDWSAPTGLSQHRSLCF